MTTILDIAAIDIQNMTPDEREQCSKCWDELFKKPKTPEEHAWHRFFQYGFLSALVAPGKDEG